MIESVEFVKDWRCFKKGDVFEFNPGINLLAGDQGCGKSSLLTLLKNEGFLNEFKNDMVATVVAPPGTQTYYMDFEKGSIRSMDADMAAARGIALGAVVANMWSSHGESVRATLKQMPKAKGAVILNDEPDMALSIRSIKLLYSWLQEHVKSYKQQIIVSCHNPYLMELVGEVYSLEHRRKMSYGEFRELMEQ